MMLPIVEEVEIDYADRLQMIWIEVDSHPEVIEKYEIQIVPTFILLREEQEIVRMAGMIGENILRERIEHEII
jgi:thioredoxin-like negative regulator of GroEL